MPPQSKSDDECYKRETVAFNSTAGPIVFQVEAGYATLGKFTGCVRRTAGWELFATGDVADSIPDVFLVPLDGTALVDSRVLIVGNYAPAHIPSGTQITIDYVFTQDGKEIHRSAIRRKKAGVVSCYYSYGFEAET
jgi:hypothetical protein